MRKLGHVPALNGLRGVAICAVVGYHAGYLPGGLLGVDLFFVLSGFLITTLLLEERAATGRISLRGFYERRARRLLPVAIAGIVFAEILLVPAFHGLHGQALAGVYSLFYVENFAHLLHPRVISQLGHYWSLSQEEQFYFVWPPILIVLLRRRVHARTVAITLGAVALLIVGHRLLLADDWWRFYYSPDTHADGMALGCLLAVARLNGWLRPGRSWQILGAVAVAAFALELAFVKQGTAAVGLYGIAVANLAGVALIASVLTSPTGPLARLLALRPVVFVGLISYSLYIWQPLVASSTGVTGLIMVAVAVPVAWLSYHYIEKPFRSAPAAADQLLAVQPAT